MSIYRDEFLRLTSENLGFNAYNLFQKKRLSKSVYSNLGKDTTINTVNGVKTLPYALSIIILYYRDQSLSQLFAEHQYQAISNNREFDKEKYEKGAMKIRDYYDQIIFFYNDDYKRFKQL